jgi:hypothetical protein
MIGVACVQGQEPFVSEFFELFKVQWEWCVATRQYDVVITTGNTDALPQAKLLIVFGPEKKSCDLAEIAKLSVGSEAVLLEHEGHRFPIYREVSALKSPHKPILKIVQTGEVVGVEHNAQGQRIIRIGYDLFGEVEYLLSNGQPPDQALFPTLDIHIGLLRNWIVGAGICLVEIPPVPSGYGFVACLTHDVDFVNMRDHQPFDRSVLGFIARSIFPSNLRDTRSEIVWSRIVKNWRALLSLPAVYLGLSRDIWFDIDRYMELERGLGSTFYFIPLKGHAGESRGRTEPHWRAARYDVKEYRVLIAELKRENAEIGLHGLDAWQDPQKGMREKEILRSLSGEESVGIRMHWLYFSKESSKILEEAGFAYDSTVGYNEANGFRCGTTQVFCLPGSKRLLELSLNVMDTALFYSERMGLSEAEAMEQCKKLITALRSYGGVLTINWHTRSLSPERNWDSFYLELLDLLKVERVWFATARAAVEWFRRRRQIRFEDVEVTSRGVKVKLRTTNAPNSPGFTLRVHNPGKVVKTADRDQSSLGNNWIDAPFTGEPEIEVTV